MSKQPATKMVIHSFNGNIDDVKFIEVDGAKFVDDGTGKAKVGDDGKPVPYVPKQDDGKGAGSDADKSLEELAKTNPAVAELLKKNIEAEKKASEAEAEASRKRQEDLAKAGEWEKLAKEQEAEIARLKEEDKKKFDLLGKYQGSIKSILASTIATIPKDKLALIPDNFSDREKLEYITKNAKLLGATIIGSPKGDKIEGNDGAPDATEEEGVRKELQALIDKGAKRTPSEDKLMIEKSRKLKELQTARQNAKK